MNTLSQEQIVPISGYLAKLMKDLFYVGGFALAFGFAGLLLMMVANFNGGNLQIPLFVIGALLTFACLAFFLYTSLRAKSTVQRVAEDLPLLDALQRTAFQATELASVTQSYAFKHLEKIQVTISIVVPMIESLPGVGPIIKRFGLTNVTKLSEAIVVATDGTKAIVLELQEAIRKGDLKEILHYEKQLEVAVRKLKAELKNET